MKITHAMYDDACALSAAIAYVEGWRVSSQRAPTLLVARGASRTSEMSTAEYDAALALALFFADGGELDWLLQRQLFAERRSRAVEANKP